MLVPSSPNNLMDFILARARMPLSVTLGQFKRFTSKTLVNARFAKASSFASVAPLPSRFPNRTRFNCGNFLRSENASIGRSRISMSSVSAGALAISALFRRGSGYWDPRLCEAPGNKKQATRPAHTILFERVCGAHLIMRPIIFGIG